MTRRNEHADFVFRMGHIDFVRHVESSAAQDELPQLHAACQHGIKNSAQAVYKRARKAERLFGALHADGFGHKFAENPKEECKDGNNYCIQDYIQHIKRRYPAPLPACTDQPVKQGGSCGKGRQGYSHLSHT